MVSVAHTIRGAGRGGAVRAYWLAVAATLRTVDWDGDAVVIVEQTLLPERLELVRLGDVPSLCDAIRRLAVRGAPALGVAGALGVALAAQRADDVDAAARLLAEARPTAVNLAWGVRRVHAVRDAGAEAMLREALAVLAEEVAVERALAVRGASLLGELCGRERGLRLLTHCNTGALATVETGTALGVIVEAHRLGGVEHVWATETRPLLQGARLTAWELQRAGVPHSLIVDGAAAWAITRCGVDAVLVGADRIAANGDVANKVGTLALALAAQHARVPFVVVAPESTVDASTPDGDAIVIEDRAEDEVLGWRGVRTAPDGTRAFNPAFDVTPARLVTAIVTEQRVLRPAIDRTQSEA